MPRLRLVSYRVCGVLLLICCIYLFFHSSDQNVTTPVLNYKTFRLPPGIKHVTTKITVLNSDPKVSHQNPQTADFALAACRIPQLEQNNSDVLKSYASSPKITISCDKSSQNWLFVDPKGKLQLTDFGKRKLDISKLKCQLQYFFRKDDLSLNFEDAGIIDVGYEITKGDFVKIKCVHGTEKWEHYFMTIVPLANATERYRNAKRSPRWSGLSVYWFAFDSLSQMAFRRLLPKTTAFLEQQLGAVVFNGYNIVGDGTPQAYIPILTGQTEQELPLTRKRYSEAQYVDVYPFVWYNFSDAGYATLYGEDAARIGTFTYRLKGFKKQPTDHYMRTFFMESEKFFPYSTHCFGSETQFQAYARYAREFMEKYPRDVPKFAVVHHSDLSHDSVTLVKTADDDLVAHLQGLRDSGAFDNAVVFVAADHGHRFNQLRETQQGQMEERLPFLAVALPKAFAQTEKGQKVATNLKKNANRLTTPFDIHATFLDILDLPENLDNNQNTENRSLSLFRPIPESRSCKQAGVEPHWCTCLDWQPANDTNAEDIALSVVQVINDYTVSERELCAPLRLHAVIEAKMLVPDSKVLKYGGVSDADGFVPKFTGNAEVHEATYMVTFTTLPGNARYEATVQYDSVEDEIVVDMLAISHVNKYGDTPHCIIDKNYFMATYCVCYDKIEGAN